MATVYGYVRGSTSKQELTLVAQTECLQRFYDYKFKTTHDFVIIEDASTSATKGFEKRAGGAKILRQAKMGDAVIVTKLDRAFRSMRDMAQTMEVLKEKGVAVHLLDINVSTDSDVGKLMAGILASVADFERSRIVTRTREVQGARRKYVEEFFAGATPFNTSMPIGYRNTPYCWRWSSEHKKGFEMPEEKAIGEMLVKMYLRVLAQVKASGYERQMAVRPSKKKEKISIHKRLRQALMSRMVAKSKKLKQIEEMASTHDPVAIATCRVNAINEISSRISQKIGYARDIRVGPSNEDVAKGIVDNHQYTKRTHVTYRLILDELERNNIKIPQAVANQRCWTYGRRLLKQGKLGWTLKLIALYVRNELKAIGGSNAKIS
jgi:DNA invertase Pin-like site-specific DNA recombinase